MIVITINKLPTNIVSISVRRGENVYYPSILQEKTVPVIAMKDNIKHNRSFDNLLSTGYGIQSVSKDIYIHTHIYYLCPRGIFSNIYSPNVGNYARDELAHAM